MGDLPSCSWLARITCGKFTLKALYLLVGSLCLSACGQLGPLYLPDTGGEVITRPSTEQVAVPQKSLLPLQQSHE